LNQWLYRLRFTPVSRNRVINKILLLWDVERALALYMKLEERKKSQEQLVESNEEVEVVRRRGKNPLSTYQ